MHGIKIPLQDFAPKMQGGLMREEGRICGTLRYIVLALIMTSPFVCQKWGEALPFTRISCVHVISLFLAHSPSAGRNPQYRSIVFLLVQHGV